MEASTPTLAAMSWTEKGVSGGTASNTPSSVQVLRIIKTSPCSTVNTFALEPMLDGQGGTVMDSRVLYVPF
jgi:hypothetical protein